MNPPTILRDRPALTAFNAIVLREPFSGVEVAVYELACALARATTAPLCIHVPQALARDVPLSPLVNWRRQAIPFQLRALRIAWEQVMLPLWLRRQGAARLHAPAYVAPLLAPCPTILTLYDLHVFSHPGLCRRLNRLHYRQAIPASIRRASAIIVPSEHTRAIVMSTLGVPPERLHVFPLGVSERFRPVTDQLQRSIIRDRLSLPERFLLSVGKRDPRKNLPMLIEAWRLARARLPDLALVLVGSGAETDVEIGPEPGLIQLGYVDSADLPTLYTLSEALVYPSVDEGYGLPAIEAMACGCPVICTSAAPAEISPASVVRTEANATSLAEAIVHTIANPPYRRQRIRAGLAAAAERSWDVVAQRTLALYNTI